MFGAVSVTEKMLRSALAGSQADMDQIIVAVEPQVRLMVAARLSPSPANFIAVDELTQEAVVGLLNGIPQLRNQTPAGLTAYVSGLVSRKVAAFLRDKAGKNNVGKPAVASLDSMAAGLASAGPLWQLLSVSGASPPSEVDRAALASEVLIELGQLKPDHREVIALAFFDQLPTAEIASRLELSREAASMLLLRAIRALRRNLTGSSRVGG